jgi:hypothetical protein
MEDDRSFFTLTWRAVTPGRSEPLNSLLPARTMPHSNSLTFSSVSHSASILAGEPLGGRTKLRPTFGRVD